MKPTGTTRNKDIGKGRPAPAFRGKRAHPFGQYAALKAVNTELIGLYWDIGRMIVERQEHAGWGKAVVEQVAADISAEFPGVAGFSASTLSRMKAFLETYKGMEKLAPLVREIGWSHNLAILERCKNPLEREIGVTGLLSFKTSPGCVGRISRFILFVIATVFLLNGNRLFQRHTRRHH